ncbi:MAG: gluconate 2-dehydrogenase subunit 3 family protein [Terracidiphilus sp.]
MQRRDFVKAMIAASVTAKAALAQQSAAPAAPVQQAAIVPPRAPAPPGPVPWMEGLMEAKPLPMTPLVPDAVAQTHAHFFTDLQFAALCRLCEILVPPIDGYPGAMEVGTPEFLDFLIAASPNERQQTYRSGLDRLDAEARQKFGVEFAMVTAAQADEIIRPWLRAWMPDHLPSEGFEHFINLAHSDIRFATINSQGWSEADVAAGNQVTTLEPYWYPVDPDMRRQAHEAASRSTAPPQHS